MPILIIGGGIIGTATAYYLSQSEQQKIHIIDTSPRAFASASGFAGGFLARDWFGPALAPLGALSFDLHRKLAAEHDGPRQWGYAASTAFSLGIDEGLGVGSGHRDEDWLAQGTSRANVAATGEGDVLDRADGSPAWVTPQRGGSFEPISSPDGCAQIDPRRLCEFLLRECRARGVEFHLSTRATGIADSEDGSGGVTVTLQTEHGPDDEKPAATEWTLSPVTSILFAAGAWTRAAFTTLFPESKLRLPITSLAGHSIVVHSPRHVVVPEKKRGPQQPQPQSPSCHAIFAGPSRGRWAFAPEFISRSNGEIYVAGVNSETLPLPRLATDAAIDSDSAAELRAATVRLLGSAATTGGTAGQPADDLRVVREAVCWRPVATRGTPILARIRDEDLNPAATATTFRRHKNRAGQQEAGPGQGEYELETGESASEPGGVYVAAGHGPWGISLSLGTGLVMAEMVRGRKTLSARVDALGLGA